MKKLIGSNAFLIVVSVFVSVLIWIFVAYSKNPVHEKWVENVPITYINQAESFKNGKLVITEKSHETVRVKVRGSRMKISKVNSGNINCTVNMANINRSGDYTLSVTAATSVEGAEILQKNPNNLNISIDDVVTRERNVEIEYTGALKEGYILGETVMNTQAVKLTGPESIIEKVKKVAVTVDLTEISEDIGGSYKIKLFNSSGAELVNTSISKNLERVDLAIKVFATKKVKIKPILAISENINGEKITVSSVEPDTILLKGKIEDLDKIDEIYTNMIDSMNFTESSTTEIDLDLSTLPKGVQTADDGAHELKYKVKYAVEKKTDSSQKE